MARAFSLQTLLDLMAERKDEAAKHLGRLIAAERSEENKLAMLQQYRDEYAARFTRAAQDGLDPQAWRNYQMFLTRLDEAINQQRGVIILSRKKREAGQKNWLDANNRENAIDTLRQRHVKKQEKTEARQEQKLQDEYAGRSKPGSPSGEGA